MSNMGNSPIFAVIILIVFSIFIYNDAVRVRLTNAVCFSGNYSRCMIHNCRLKALQRNKIVFNFNATFYYQVNYITANVQMVKKANGFKPWLYNVTLNVCDFLKKRNNPVVNMIYNMFKDNSNINHSCPYMGPIIINEFYLKPDTIPLPMPSGEYGVLMTGYLDNMFKVIVKLYFEYIED